MAVVVLLLSFTFVSAGLPAGGGKRCEDNDAAFAAVMSWGTETAARCNSAGLLCGDPVIKSMCCASCRSRGAQLLAAEGDRHEVARELSAMSAGLTPACVDYAPAGRDRWHSALGDSYDCSWHARYDNCFQFGRDPAHAKFGYTASEACCACQSTTATDGPTAAPATAAPPGLSRVSNTLGFLCAGAHDEVAHALEQALLIIHGGDHGALSVVVSQAVGGDGTQAMADWWGASYEIVAQQGVAGMHLAIAGGMGVGTGLGETATIMASAFAAQGLVLSKSSLALGVPQLVAETTATQTTATQRPSTASTTTQTETYTRTETSLSSSTLAASSRASSDGSAATAASSRTSDTTTTTQAVCKDYKPPFEEKWYDRSGKQYDCGWYAHSRCPTLNALRNFGMVGKQACCACGGGVFMEDRRTSAPTTSSPLENDEDLAKGPLESLLEGDGLTLMCMIVATMAGACFLCGCAALCAIGIRCPDYFGPDEEAEDKQTDGATATQQRNEHAARGSSRLDPAAVATVDTIWWQADAPVRSSTAQVAAWRQWLDDPRPLEPWSYGNAHNFGSPQSHGEWQWGTA